MLGVNALFSTAYGNVGSSIYYALGLVASYALGLTPIVFIITGFFFFCTAASYAEATTMYPEAGGSSSFARRAFNEFWSFFAAWAQMLTYICTIAISAFFVPHYIGGLFWAALRHSPGDIIAGAAVIVVLAVINVVGVKESTGVNVLLALIDFMTQLLLVVVGFFLVFSPQVLADNVHLGVAPTWKNFVLAIPIGMLAYTGIETISNMSEEARDEATTIPAAINRVRLAVFAIYFTLPAIALSALPVHQRPDGSYYTLLGLSEEQGGYAGDPILGVVKRIDLGPLQSAGEIYVGLLAATILLIAANAGIIGVSRLTYSMGQHQQLPDRVREISPRFRTPANGILIFGLIACVVIIPGKEEFLGTLYAFGAMLSFTIAHVSLIGLRWRLARNKMREIPGDVEVEGEDVWYKAPFNARFQGVDIPLFAVIGGLGTFAAWIAVMALYTDALIAGVIWLVLGSITYVAYRRRKGLSLTETTVVKLPAPVGAEPVRYASVLVAFEEGTYSESAMAVALKLATHKRGDVRVISTVTVPPALDLDAPLPQAEATAAAVIETARQWAGRGQRVRGRVVKVRPGEAGHRIVREAREARSDAIVMPMPRRRPSGKVLNQTLAVVLAKRPARVIIDSTPAYPLTGDEDSEEAA